MVFVCLSVHEIEDKCSDKEKSVAKRALKCLKALAQQLSRKKSFHDADSRKFFGNELPLVRIHEQ